MLWRPLALAALNQPADRAAAPPFARQCRENGRTVHVTLMVRREDHRPFEIFEMLQPINVDPREHTGQWEKEHGLANRAHPANGHRPIPPGKIHRLRQNFRVRVRQLP